MFSYLTSLYLVAPTVHTTTYRKAWSAVEEVSSLLEGPRTLTSVALDPGTERLEIRTTPFSLIASRRDSHVASRSISP